MSTTIVIGGQYGSEGKGAFIAWLTDPARQGKRDFLVVRTGGPNAGHSMKYRDGTFKMRHIPCSWHNPHAVLALGPGAVVDPVELKIELAMVEAVAPYPVARRFFIDPMCAVITETDRNAERGLVERIGSTGEGVGQATARRVMRSGPVARDWPTLQPFLRDVSELAQEYKPPEKNVIVESTQGFGLSLTRSGFYPNVTSRDLTPGAIISDAGIPVLGRGYVILVLRTYPIRVAGPSGPMANETTWERLAERTDGYIKPERTTVTDKIRRVGEWDPEIAKKAIRACSPDFIALTFFDYWRPDLAGRTNLDADAFRKIDEIEKELEVPIVWVSTGFQTITQLRVG